MLLEGTGCFPTFFETCFESVQALDGFLSYL